ncbi:hypothetical protein LSTR_LSTR001598 [Laodelphax striatellus]|uniref:MADF domain-containing protein n=1 Tax=Laodelphax striatellus TaxID=195883 RepID=A0A482XCC2_LAOST|nr:hypothetical protein LSTR_LSTR001598 [Laodelphax striatellus]
MFDKKLIECVRKNPILYDLSHPEYMDTELKSDVWKKIGAELKVEGGTCKTRWNRLRDCYRKFLKRNAQGLMRSQRYKYAKEMRFLQNPLNQNCISFEDDQTSDTEEKLLEDTLIDHITAEDAENSKPEVVEHPVDAFLNAMAPSLKALSPLNWHQAKSEIFSIVQKYDLRTLTGQGQVQLQLIKLHNSATPFPSTLPLLKPKGK